MVEIRKAQAGEGQAIAEVYVASAHHAYEDILNESYHREHLDEQLQSGHWVDHCEALLSNPAHRLYVADEDGLVVGFALLTPVNDGVGELEQLFFVPTSFGRGIGPAMHDQVLRYATEQCWRALQAEVVERNERAMAFYRRYGWVEAHRYVHTTRGGDTVTMCWLERTVP